MKRIIELKHVGPRDHVRLLLEDLLDRLESKLTRFSADATSAHIVFEEHRGHKLFGAVLTCHIPGHILAAHEELRDPGEAIRKVFADVERQLQKHKATLNHQPLRKPPKALAPRDTAEDDE